MLVLNSSVGGSACGVYCMLVTLRCVAVSVVVLVVCGSVSGVWQCHWSEECW